MGGGGGGGEQIVISQLLYYLKAYYDIWGNYMYISRFDIFLT